MAPASRGRGWWRGLTVVSCAWLGPGQRQPLSWVPGMGAAGDEARHGAAEDEARHGTAGTETPWGMGAPREIAAAAIRSGTQRGMESPQGMPEAAPRSGRGAAQNQTREREAEWDERGIFFFFFFLR